MSTRNISWG